MSAQEPIDADAFAQAIAETGQLSASMSELAPPRNAPRRYFELGRAYQRALQRQWAAAADGDLAATLKAQLNPGDGTDGPA